MVGRHVPFTTLLRVFENRTSSRAYTYMYSHDYIISFVHCCISLTKSEFLKAYIYDILAFPLKILGKRNLLCITNIILTVILLLSVKT
jgi:hypothetical protein